MISEKAVKIHVEFYSFLYRIEVDETSLREFAAILLGLGLLSESLLFTGVARCEVCFGLCCESDIAIVLLCKMILLYGTQ